MKDMPFIEYNNKFPRAAEYEQNIKKNHDFETFKKKKEEEKSQYHPNLQQESSNKIIKSLVNYPPESINKWTNFGM